MGYWPGKICAVLNIVIMLGYGMIDCLIGGQVLSAVADGQLTIVVGIIIIALISWLVVLFGMTPFQVYERYDKAPRSLICLRLILTNLKDGHGYHNSSRFLCWLVLLAPSSILLSHPREMRAR